MAKGLILILHNGFAKVSIEECLDSLPEEWKKLDREKIEVSYSEMLSLPDWYNANFAQFALEHRRQFVNEIAPLLEKKSDYLIVYFGLAPIPLTIDFGQLFYNYRNVEVFQRHHVKKRWYRELEEEKQSGNQIKTSGLPEKDQKGISTALIRISSSHYVNPEETAQVIANAAEVEVSFENPNEDAITSPEQMTAMAETVKSAFDTLSHNRSELKEIHLFASIPCGLAFLIGTKISPNIHPYIQTYQYSRTAEPCYKKAILVKGRINPERKITDEDNALAMHLRQMADSELKGTINIFCKENQRMSNGRKWYLGVVPELDHKNEEMNVNFWNDLPALCDTSLKEDSFSLKTDTIQDGFFWRKNEWFVDDNFFISLNGRIGNGEKIKQAIRLFLFHEALHYKKHNLTDTRAVNIGSFPKVLETADYQADVYAILNEYGFHIHIKGGVADPKSFFLDVIGTATETMWSFDDAGVPLTEIQIRRLNRYMIWYWQYARIEKNGNSLNDIVKILAEKPVIELNGLKTKEENNRFYYELEKRPDQPLELGVFYGNRVIRNGSATNMAIENLVTGVKEMKGELLLNVMRSFLE